MEIQQIVLLKIDESGVTPKELAGVLNINRQSVSGALTRLYRGGVVTREKTGRTYTYKSKQCALNLQ